MFLTVSVFNTNSRRTSAHRVRKDHIIQIGPVMETAGLGDDHELTLFRVRFITLSSGRGLTVEDSPELSAFAAA